jgi:hypothetical protein
VAGSCNSREWEEEKYTERKQQLKKP